METWWTTHEKIRLNIKNRGCNKQTATCNYQYYHPVVWSRSLSYFNAKTTQITLHVYTTQPINHPFTSPSLFWLVWPHEKTLPIAFTSRVSQGIWWYMYLSEKTHTTNPGLTSLNLTSSKVDHTKVMLTWTPYVYHHPPPFLSLYFGGPSRMVFRSWWSPSSVLDMVWYGDHSLDGQPSNFLMLDPPANEKTAMENQ